MTTEVLKLILEKEGYFNIREIEGRGLCGLMRFAFTIGLVYGMGKYLYDGRYCYSNLSDANEALNNWSGIGDPQDEHWIKHKGDYEYSNPKKITHDK